MTLSARQITELMTLNGLHASRALGQNFVGDPNTVRRIARLAGVGPGDRVVEIGAGLGSLSLALAETGAKVLAVEIDHYLVPVLRQVVAQREITVVEGDALRLDWSSVLDASGLSGERPWVLVANLPYNIATPLVADLLDGVPAIGRMLVMVQREVGERLAAAVGDPAYGAVSVKVAYWGSARMVGRVPASVFVPQPRVESVLVAIERRERPAVDPSLVGPDQLFALVRAGFAQRRKMLRRSLAAFGVPAQAWVGAGVSPESRAEALDVGAWGRLAAALAETPDPEAPAGEAAARGVR